MLTEQEQQKVLLGSMPSQTIVYPWESFWPGDEKLDGGRRKGGGLERAFAIQFMYPRVWECDIS